MNEDDANQVDVCTLLLELTKWHEKYHLLNHFKRYIYIFIIYEQNRKRKERIRNKMRY